MLLNREDYYHKNDDDYSPDSTAELIIAKQRNGPTGSIQLTFRQKLTRFENASQIEESPQFESTSGSQQQSVPF